jgi:hypothetical protein
MYAGRLSASTQAPAQPTGTGMVDVDANRDHAFVAAAVTHHADGFERQQHRERLPDSRTEASRRSFFHHDRVVAPQHVEAIARDFADDSHRQTGTGERLAIDNLRRETETPASFAHFVFE